MTSGVNYGNWVSIRLVFVPSLIGLIFLASALLYVLLLIPALLSLSVSVYFAYARRLFSPGGGDVQSQIREMVLANLSWDGEGRAIDIGCGNGSLAIQLAKKYDGAQVTGIDYWGRGWEYSKANCERNAELEGVKGRATFQKASASSLPFEDGYFDAAVSNLVFHEVGDAADKREVVREALRVVRKGGSFSFQDLFLVRKLYGEPDELLSMIRGWGISEVKFVQTRQAPFIPGALKLSFMVGSIGIIAGEK
jgi:SAM-dependent methyltransferase